MQSDIGHRSGGDGGWEADGGTGQRDFDYDNDNDRTGPRDSRCPAGSDRRAPPLISAVVPAWQAAAHLADCITSILDQRGTFRLELIVVDDGSTDATAEIATSLIPVAAAKGVPMRLLRQANAGPSAARNAGIAAATGDWVAFLDSDDRMPPDRLASQLALLDGAPDLALIFGDCLIFAGDGIVLPSFFAEAGLDLAFFGDPVRVLGPWEKLFRLNYIPTGAVLVRRDCLRAVGGFDPTLRLVEDLDLWLRLARRCAVGYTRHCCEHKRRHGANISADQAAMTAANIAVLTRHWQADRALLRARGVRLASYLCREYCLLGDYREQAGRLREARACYRRGLLLAPGPRPLFYWLRCLWRQWHRRR